MRAGSCDRVGLVRLPLLRAEPQCAFAALRRTPLSSTQPRREGVQDKRARAQGGGSAREEADACSQGAESPPEAVAVPASRPPRATAPSIVF